MNNIFRIKVNGIQCEYIAFHRITNEFDNKKGVTKLRASANTESCSANMESCYCT